MNPIERAKHVAEYLCGQRDDPPSPRWARAAWIVAGVSWAAFLAIAWIFCGQTSKFIYIDF